MNEDTQIRLVSSMPPIAGWWVLANGYFRIQVSSKPCWFHRVMNRLLIGWKWEDA